jgi:hypothetical protein
MTEKKTDDEKVSVPRMTLRALAWQLWRRANEIYAVDDGVTDPEEIDRLDSRDKSVRDPEWNDEMAFLNRMSDELEALAGPDPEPPTNGEEV